MLQRRDTTGSAPPARPWSRAGRAEALALLAVALLAAALFASGTLDVGMARWFYRSGAAEHWPLARRLPWSLLYRSATWITAALVIAGLAALLASFAPSRSAWRRPALLLLLSIVIGPGLLGNVLFKDHWQHPRPRDIVELGGPLHYAPSPLPGRESGASFPCGHCTVGFLVACGWWIWRRRRPVWAAASLAAGVTLGVLLGLGRMAAGGHFFSDIVWSALLAFAVVHVLHYHVLPRAGPAAATRPAERGQLLWRRVYGSAALLGGVGVLLALFATPHGAPLTTSMQLTADSPRLLEVEAGTANVAIVLLDTPASRLTIDGELHGFGVPTSRLMGRLEVVSLPERAVRYRIETHGWLTDVDGLATLYVPASAFDRVSVAVHRGDIRVSDMTRAGVVRDRRLQLDLHTDSGHLQLPAGR